MKIIRDCIFNYISISNLEVDLLSKPEVLRLQKILQCSTAFITYPNNRSNRYSHSIGVMHVAGVLYKSLIQNSDKQFSQKINKAVWDSLDREHKLASSRYLKCECNSEKSFYVTVGWDVRDSASSESNICNNIILQSLRLAALVHDIGQPPYSHIIEFAIEDFLQLCDDKFDSRDEIEISNSYQKLDSLYSSIIKKYLEIGNIKSLFSERAPLHEKIGIVIINKLFEQSNNKALFSKLSKTQQDEFLFRESCLITALRILTIDQLGFFKSDAFKNLLLRKENEKYITLYPLGQIINGEVDCDRLDNHIRDAISSGTIKHTSYDIERLFYTITLVDGTKLYPADIQKNFGPKPIIVGFDRRAISTLSDFFNDRFRQRRWLINHHNVVRTDLAITRIIRNLIYVYFSNSEIELAEFLKKNSFSELWKWINFSDSKKVTKNEEDYEINSLFRYKDDSWLDYFMSNLHNFLITKEKTNALNGLPKEIFFLLEVLVSRKISYLEELWKRIDDFLPFSEGFCQIFKSKIKTQEYIEFINKWTDGSEIIYKLNDLRNPKDNILVTNKITEYYASKQLMSGYSNLTKIEEKINSKLNNKIYFVFKKYKPYKDVPILLKDNQVKNLHDISSLVSQINKIADSDLRLYGYEMPLEEKLFIKNSSDLHKLGSDFAENLFTELYNSP